MSIARASSSSLLLLLLLLLAIARASASSQGEATVRELLSRGVANGVITDEQESKLLALAERLGVREREEGEGGGGGGEGEAQGTFMRLYGHLTLLNVLYFGGSLLIMAAYTLLMSLAWERYGGKGLGSLLLLQVILLGAGGVSLWRGPDEYQFVGGLLCTISTSMVPFTVYNIQRGLKLWPEGDSGVFQDFRNYVRGWFVGMEVATILVGCGFLTVVRFPFLVSPVAFALWFLSMDLAPAFPGWYAGFWGMVEIRRQLSIAFGAAMIALGYVAELSLGSHPDFGFWLYLFGLISFCSALSFDFPAHDSSASVYLLTHVCLGLLGSHLDRTTFHVFATMGVVLYVTFLLSNRTNMSRSLPLWLLKALVAAALLVQAVRREGNIEILGAITCLLAFNFNSMAFWGSGEHYFLLLLLTNLGFASCAALFERPLHLWLFSISDASGPIGLVFSLTVGLFHVGLARYSMSLASADSVLSYVYHGYRLAAATLIALAFVFIRQPWFAWVGGVGIVAVAANFSALVTWKMVRRRHTSSAMLHNVIATAILVFGTAFSIHLQSNLLYLLHCLCLLPVVLSFMEQWKEAGCAVSTLLILMSVPLQSKFLIAIGGVYIFAYLSHLAYRVFKDSLLFPLALIALGTAVIFTGVKYQQSEGALHARFDGMLPDALRALLHHSVLDLWQPHGLLDWQHYLQQTSFSVENFRRMPFNWLLWPAALVHALAGGPVSHLAYLCGGSLVALLVALAGIKFRQTLVKDLLQSVKVSELKFSLSTQHSGHGIVVAARGRKPRDLHLPKNIALQVSGDGFWRVTERAYGEWKIGLARSMFLPYRLTPHLISFSGFTKGSDSFSATILLGTGHAGSQRLSHHTLHGTLRTLTAVNSSATMTCSLLYSDSWYAPYSKLCEDGVTLGQLSDSLDK